MKENNILVIPSLLYGYKMWT